MELRRLSVKLPIRAIPVFTTALSMLARFSACCRLGRWMTTGSAPGASLQTVSGSGCTATGADAHAPILLAHQELRYAVDARISLEIELRRMAVPSYVSRLLLIDEVFIVRLVWMGSTLRRCRPHVQHLVALKTWCVKVTLRIKACIYECSVSKQEQGAHDSCGRFANGRLASSP